MSSRSPRLKTIRANPVPGFSMGGFDMADMGVVTLFTCFSKYARGTNWIRLVCQTRVNTRKHTTLDPTVEIVEALMGAHLM